MVMDNVIAVRQKPVNLGAMEVKINNIDFPAILGSSCPKAVKRKVWEEGELKSTDWSNVILRRNSLYHNAI